MTTRAKNTVKDIIAGVPQGKALKKNGYRDTYAENPQRFMQTNQVQKWLAQHYPDELLAEVGLKGLKATKIHGTGDDFIEIPDHDAQYKFWKDIMKARGKMSENVGNTYNQVNISWDSQGDSSSNNPNATKLNPPKR